jgi:hypothetical protein
MVVEVETVWFRDPAARVARRVLRYPERVARVALVAPRQRRRARSGRARLVRLAKPVRVAAYQARQCRVPRVLAGVLADRVCGCEFSFNVLRLTTESRKRPRLVTRMFTRRRSNLLTHRGAQSESLRPIRSVRRELGKGS